MDDKIPIFSQGDGWQGPVSIGAPCMLLSCEDLLTSRLATSQSNRWRGIFLGLQSLLKSVPGLCSSRDLWNSSICSVQALALSMRLRLDRTSKAQCRSRSSKNRSMWQ